MKKFKFKIHGNDYQVEILNFEDNIAEIEVNGAVYKVELQQEMKAIKTPKLMRSATVAAMEIADKPKTSKPTEKKGAGQIKAPLPGVILHTNVKAGDKIKIGDTLLVMEAMKMENNINSDKEGTIAQVLVKQGDSVLEGDLLVEIES